MVASVLATPGQKQQSSASHNLVITNSATNSTVQQPLNNSAGMQPQQLKPSFVNQSFTTSSKN